jgi:hypothetical protein
MISVASRAVRRRSIGRGDKARGDESDEDVSTYFHSICYVLLWLGCINYRHIMTSIDIVIVDM